MAFTEIELVVVTIAVWAAAWLPAGNGFGAQWFGAHWFGSQWFGAQWFGSQWSLGTWSVEVSAEAGFVVGVILVSLAIADNRKFVMAVGLVLVAFSLSSIAEGEYFAERSSGFVEDKALITSDPEPLGLGSRAEAKLSDGRRVELIGFGTEGFELEQVGVGSSVEISGTMRPVGDRPWLKTRHIVGSVSVSSVGASTRAPLWRLPPEMLRSFVFAGSAVLSESDQALYNGLVVGDDRFQTADQKAQFQVSGLTHLLAVSGQNVAFVLAVLAPGLLRLRRAMRWSVVLLALVVFAVATRAEPSVLRATLSVGLATTLTLLGLKTSGIRILSLVSIILIYLDPFLARSVGFQLSVAASAGILLVGPVLHDMELLPSFIWTPLAITLSAQVAVAPLLLIHFGRLGLVSIPANLLAGWAAGAVMMWGLTVGVVAGLAPPQLSGVLQLPVELLLWWIKTVASVSARSAAPVLTGTTVIPFFGLCVVVMAVKRRFLRFLAVGSLVGVLALITPQSPQVQTDLGYGLYVPSSQDTPSVLIVRSGAPDRLVFWVVENRINEIDIVVFEQGDRHANGLAQALNNVVRIGRILAPSQHRVVGAYRVTEVTQIRSAALVEIESTDTKLTITIEGELL